VCGCPADIALVVDAAGTIVERYLFGDGVDNVLSREKAGVVVWSLGDRQGSVVDLVKEDGTILNHFVYDGFGNSTGTTGVDFRFGYTGRELDTETGLYYYRARYYEPLLGRFISEDPIGFAAGDTNLYRYVNNNPTNYTDPTGELAQVAGGAIFGGIFGGLYALANDIESGQFGWGTFGRVAQGAVIGAAIGALASIGLAAATNVLAAGFQAVLGANTALGVATAGTIVNTTAAAGGAVVGAYNAGGNFGRGKYLTGTLDLFGAAAAARNVVNGVKGFNTARLTDLASAIDNLPMPGTPPQLSSSGEIVPAGSSALANRTAVGGAIAPYSHPSAGQLVLANSAASALSEATSRMKLVGEGFFSDDPNGIPIQTNRPLVRQLYTHDCLPSACATMLESYGLPYNRATLQADTLYVPGRGTYMENGATTLKVNGLLSTRLRTEVKFNDFVQLIEQGEISSRHPAIVEVQGDGRNSTHAVVVDGITMHEGKRYISIRDPEQGEFIYPLKAFRSYYEENIILTNSFAEQTNQINNLNRLLGL
jgi:RHS repeat-associated protein